MASLVLRLSEHLTKQIPFFQEHVALFVSFSWPFGSVLITTSSFFLSKKIINSYRKEIIIPEC